MYTDDYLDELQEALKLVEDSASDAQHYLKRFRAALCNHEIARDNLSLLIEKGTADTETERIF